MSDKTTIKIFIASSSELEKEREKSISVLLRLNQAHSHLHLEPVLWEYAMVRGSHSSNRNILELIPPQLNERRLAIFMFFSKIGQYTLDEFEYARRENMKLFAYFKMGISSIKSDIHAYREVLNFKNQLNETVLYADYTDLNDFERKLYADINLYLSVDYPKFQQKKPKNFQEAFKIIIPTAIILSVLIAIVLIFQTERNTRNLETSRVPLPDLVAIPADQYSIGITNGQMALLLNQGFGNSASDFENETPQITISTDSFYISKYEITVSQFGAYIREQNIAFPVLPEGFGDSTQPIMNITWYEANEYCEWLSSKTGESYRLPNEIEWEVAAKGKAKGDFVWGNDFPNSERNCNFGGILNKTVAIGEKPFNKSVFGVYNMSGNVAEWCNDWYHPNHYQLIRNNGQINNLPQTRDKVLRGGGWRDNVFYVRCTARKFAPPDTKSDAIGFRVVKEVKR